MVFHREKLSALKEIAHHPVKPKHLRSLAFHGDRFPENRDSVAWNSDRVLEAPRWTSNKAEGEDFSHGERERPVRARRARKAIHEKEESLAQRDKGLLDDRLQRGCQSYLRSLDDQDSIVAEDYDI